MGRWSLVWSDREKTRHSFRGLAAPLGASRRVRVGELLESHGKARSNSTTAAGHGECSRGALRLARGPLARRARVRGASALCASAGAEAQMQSHEDNNASRPSLPAFDLSKS